MLRETIRPLQILSESRKNVSEAVENNDTDEEMQLLQNVYQQVAAGGWLN